MIGIHPLGTINVSVKFNFDNVDTLQPGPKWWSATHKSALSSPELKYFNKVFFRVNTMQIVYNISVVHGMQSNKDTSEKTC